MVLATSKQLLNRMSGEAASVSITRPPRSHLVSRRGNRDRYVAECVPLHIAALRGDWTNIKRIIEHDPTLLISAITKEWSTVLHIAVGANQESVVGKLVNLMGIKDLEFEDGNGNTAFCLAAAVGNVNIAEIMRRKNESLPTIRGREGLTPLHFAVMQGRTEMARYLFDKAKEILDDNDWFTIFLIAVNSALYELALDMLNEKEPLAFARGDNQETALHVLARKPSSRSIPGYPIHLLHSWRKTDDPPIIKLTKRIWDIFLTLDESHLMDKIREPSQVTFIAAEVGNFEFLSVIMSTYPDLIWELNTAGRSIIHVAALHRHASIFNLIHEIGSTKDSLVTFKDDEGNTLLHCVAKIAPTHRLNVISGAAFQMMFELTWFEAVRKIMLPSFIEHANNEGIIARDLFRKQHVDLLEKGQTWMEKTASSCMVVSTLIATGVFSAAFTVLGDAKDKTGSPNYLEKPVFTVFAISDALALTFSIISILVFLSILISQYAVEDFLWSLSRRLISGLVSLFFSIISMMVAFSSVFFIKYYYGKTWIPITIAAFVFIPIVLFIGLQIRLWHDIMYSHHICSSLFRPSKRMIQQ